MKFNWSFGQRLEIHDRKYDVFVLYNHDSDDNSFVLDEILPLLDKHHLNHVTEDSFELGPDRFTSLQNAIRESRSALVILNSSLLETHWNLYQLNQVVCREIDQHNFKVMFLLCERLTSLENLPENLGLFLRVSPVVKKYRRNWKDNLIYELKHKTKSSVNRRLTFGNAEFNGFNLN